MSERILDQFLEEFAQLKTAEDLLYKVWCEFGPYQEDRISQRTWQEVNNFFKFDDSE